ncbi:hypothetical protein MAIT1_03929 [Magnetofaba australis IT-1]|uniref:Uncharacterized protein n=1 Tax=Magnetofaba australis IT-1 TaxID=1434232 RepID=A0A1Y2K8V7_9PROT|nr:hypothetical protein MAIT1_03929 [Magnetofaba australis IT-1]
MLVSGKDYTALPNPPGWGARMQQGSFAVGVLISPNHRKVVKLCDFPPESGMPALPLAAKPAPAEEKPEPPTAEAPKPAPGNAKQYGVERERFRSVYRI